MKNISKTNMFGSFGWILVYRSTSPIFRWMNKTWNKMWNKILDAIRMGVTICLFWVMLATYIFLSYVSVSQWICVVGCTLIGIKQDNKAPSSVSLFTAFNIHISSMRPIACMMYRMYTSSNLFVINCCEHATHISPFRINSFLLIVH